MSVDIVWCTRPCAVQMQMRSAQLGAGRVWRRNQDNRNRLGLDTKLVPVSNMVPCIYYYWCFKLLIEEQLQPRPRKEPTANMSFSTFSFH